MTHCRSCCSQVKSLQDTPYAWLAELLQCFSDGDMAKFGQLCSTYGAQMNAQPALVAAERGLKQKITIMCLVAMVSSCALCCAAASCKHIEFILSSVRQRGGTCATRAKSPGASAPANTR